MIQLDPAFATARRATLTTIDARDGGPRSVPICFAVVDGRLYSPLDEKPKAVEDRGRLRRVRNLAADPRATILIDRWSEDWRELAFTELACLGHLIAPSEADHARAVAALREKYPQYVAHRLEERPMLRFDVERATTWTAQGDG